MQLRQGRRDVPGVESVKILSRAIRNGTGGCGSAAPACVAPVSIDGHGLSQTGNREVIAMGLLLILLGLGAAGLVADYVVENDITTAPSQAVNLLGGSFSVSQPELVLAAAVLGALAVVLVMLGLGLLRGSWGRRRALKRQISDLQLENTDLRSKVHLGTALSPGSSQEPQPDAGEEAPTPES